jgi:hypothetical protein
MIFDSRGFLFSLRRGEKPVYLCIFARRSALVAEGRAKTGPRRHVYILKRYTWRKMPANARRSALVAEGRADIHRYTGFSPP